MNVKRLVAFAILMENGEGVLTKSPKYIREKYKLAMTLPLDLLIQLFDQPNSAKYFKYLKKWTSVKRG